MHPLYNVIDSNSRSATIRDTAEHVSQMILQLKEEEMRSDFNPPSSHFKLGQAILYHFGGLVSRLAAEGDCENACEKHEEDMNELMYGGSWAQQKPLVNEMFVWSGERKRKRKREKNSLDFLFFFFSCLFFFLFVFGLWGVWAQQKPLVNEMSTSWQYVCLFFFTRRSFP